MVGNGLADSFSLMYVDVFGEAFDVLLMVLMVIWLFDDFFFKWVSGGFLKGFYSGFGNRPKRFVALGGF